MYIFIYKSLRASPTRPVLTSSFPVNVAVITEPTICTLQVAEPSIGFTKSTVVVFCSLHATNGIQY